MLPTWKYYDNGSMCRSYQQLGPRSTVLLLRAVVVLCLIASAALLGSLSFWYLRREERNLFQAQYESISKSGLDVAFKLIERQSESGLTLASIYSNSIPAYDSWPNATIPGAVESQRNLQSTAGITSIAYAPLVRVEEVDAFVAYALAYFASDPNMPNTTGYHDFGIGVFKYDYSSGEAVKVPDDGSTSYSSPYNIYTPIFQASFQYTSSSMLYNWHSDVSRGQAIDGVINCSQTSANRDSCAVMSDFLLLATSRNPAEILYTPIHAANNLTAPVVGVVGTIVTFLDIFEGAVPNYVPGIHAVLSTNTAKFTYIIKDGKPSLLGEGDKHNSKYNRYRKSRRLTSPHFAESSPIYTLEFYPTDGYVEYYYTDRPLIVSLCSVAIIIFTSMVFFLYDYFMKKVSNEQLELLEAKRKFVRFISHEVRTPLNTISLGAKLLNIQLQLIADKHRESSIMSAIDDCIGLSEELLDGTDSAVMALNDMIRYDEIDVGVLRLDATLIPIIDLLRTVKKSYDILARDKRIHYELRMKRTSMLSGVLEDQNLATDTYRVIGDEMQLLHVFRNLLSNAFAHTESRGTIRIEYQWLPNGLSHKVKSSFNEDDTCRYPRAGSVLISVIDNGSGLTSQQLDALSNDKTDSSIHNDMSSSHRVAASVVTANKDGGMGLRAARSIIRSHGGDVRIHSAGSGLGSTFSVELPAYSTQVSRTRSTSGDPPASPNSAARRMSKPAAVNKVHPDDLRSPAPPDDRLIEGSMSRTTNSANDNTMSRQLPPELPAFTAKNVLVVDDAPSTRKILCRLLRNNGHVCSEADNGAKAVSAYIYCDERSPFDAILMDYEMPVMNGPTATRILRSLGFTNPIIGITGNVLPEDVHFFKKHGANDVLAKPLKMPDLEAVWNNPKICYTVQTPEQPDTDIYRRIQKETEAANQDLPLA